MESARLRLICCAILCTTVFVTPMLSAPKAERPATQLPKLTRDPRVLAALKNLDAAGDAITDEQMRITEIPAPTFNEAARGSYLAKLLSGAGLKVTTDDVGNVIGERPGRSSNDIVLLVAHLDTVFPDTTVHVRRDGERLYAPGITDNGTGLVALVALARAMRDASSKPSRRSCLSRMWARRAKGTCAACASWRKPIAGGFATSSLSTARPPTTSSPLRWLRAAWKSPSPARAGTVGRTSALPIPSTRPLARIAQFVNTPVPENPRSSFNVGEIQGGTSVNSIPASASLKVDLRSESETELAKLETALRKAVQSGVSDEMAAARSRGLGGNPLDVEFKVLGVRPGGVLPADSPLRAAVQAADDYLGNQSRSELSSTDANIPLSLGIPAIAIGAGGLSAGAHSPGEWYNPLGRELGLKRALLTLLGVAGIEPE